MSETATLNFQGSAQVKAGLWSLTQVGQNDLADPVGLLLQYPPQGVTRRPPVGPAVTILDPVIDGDVMIAARVFSLHGVAQVRARNQPAPRNSATASLTYLGLPHPLGCVPLWYSVASAGGGIWVPPWDGPYQVYSDSNHTTLVASRESGASYMVTAGPPVYITQQARI